MGRFYETSDPIFVEDSIYKPDFNLIREGLLAQEAKTQAIRDDKNGILNAYVNSDIGERDRVNQYMKETYYDSIDNIASDYAKDKDLSKFSENIQNLKRQFNNDRTTGLLSRVEDNYNKMKAYNDYALKVQDPVVQNRMFDYLNMERNKAQEDDGFFSRKNTFDSRISINYNVLQDFESKDYKALTDHINTEMLKTGKDYRTIVTSELTLDRIYNMFLTKMQTDPNLIFANEQDKFFNNENYASLYDSEGKISQNSPFFQKYKPALDALYRKSLKESIEFAPRGTNVSVNNNMGSGDQTKVDEKVKATQIPDYKTDSHVVAVYNRFANKFKKGNIFDISLYEKPFISSLKTLIENYPRNLNLEFIQTYFMNTVNQNNEFTTTEGMYAFLNNYRNIYSNLKKFIDDNEGSATQELKNVFNNLKNNFNSINEKVNNFNENNSVMYDITNTMIFTDAFLNQHDLKDNEKYSLASPLQVVGDDKKQITIDKLDTSKTYRVAGADGTYIKIDPNDIDTKASSKDFVIYARKENGKIIMTYKRSITIYGTVYDKDGNPVKENDGGSGKSSSGSNKNGKQVVKPVTIYITRDFEQQEFSDISKIYNDNFAYIGNTLDAELVNNNKRFKPL